MAESFKIGKKTLSGDMKGMLEKISGKLSEKDAAASIFTAKDGIMHASAAEVFKSAGLDEKESSLLFYMLDTDEDGALSSKELKSLKKSKQGKITAKSLRENVSGMLKSAVKQPAAEPKTRALTKEEDAKYSLSGKPNLTKLNKGNISYKAGKSASAETAADKSVLSKDAKTLAGRQKQMDRLKELGIITEEDCKSNKAGENESLFKTKLPDESVQFYRIVNDNGAEKVISTRIDKDGNAKVDVFETKKPAAEPPKDEKSLEHKEPSSSETGSQNDDAGGQGAKLPAANVSPDITTNDNNVSDDTRPAVQTEKRENKSSNFTAAAAKAAGETALSVRSSQASHTQNTENTPQKLSNEKKAEILQGIKEGSITRKDIETNKKQYTKEDYEELLQAAAAYENASNNSQHSTSEPVRLSEDDMTQKFEELKAGKITIEKLKEQGLHSDDIKKLQQMLEDYNKEQASRNEENEIAGRISGAADKINEAFQIYYTIDGKHYQNNTGELLSKIIRAQSDIEFTQTLKEFEKKFGKEKGFMYMLSEAKGARLSSEDKSRIETLAAERLLKAAGNEQSRQDAVEVICRELYSGTAALPWGWQPANVFIETIFSNADNDLIKEIDNKYKEINSGRDFAKDMRSKSFRVNIIDTKLHQVLGK